MKSGESSCWNDPMGLAWPLWGVIGKAVVVMKKEADYLRDGRMDDGERTIASERWRMDDGRTDMGRRPAPSSLLASEREAQRPTASAGSISSAAPASSNCRRSFFTSSCTDSSFSAAAGGRLRV